MKCRTDNNTLEINLCQSLLEYKECQKCHMSIIHNTLILFSYRVAAGQNSQGSLAGRGHHNQNRE